MVEEHKVETQTIGELEFNIWPYGAVVIRKGEGKDAEFFHISRYELEDYLRILSKAKDRRDEWRKANGRD